MGVWNKTREQQQSYFGKISVTVHSIALVTTATAAQTTAKWPREQQVSRLLLTLYGSTLTNDTARSVIMESDTSTDIQRVAGQEQRLWEDALGEANLEAGCAVHFTLISAD